MCDVFIGMRASRALADSCSVLFHSHNWEPFVHEFTGSCAHVPTHFPTGSSYCFPVDRVEYFVRPMVFVFAVGSERGGSMCTVYLPLIVRSDPSTIYAKHRS